MLYIRTLKNFIYMVTNEKTDFRITMMFFPFTSNFEGESETLNSEFGTFLVKTSSGIKASTFL
jgi:hypothetical protein